MRASERWLRLAAPAAGVLVAGALAGALALGDLARLEVPAEGGEPASRRARRLQTEIERLAPRGLYVVIDTYANRLRVYRGGELLREGACSTGSGYVLRDATGGREWVFDTPLGLRRVVRKTRDPVWIKPDWAFVEEGLEPPAAIEERRDDVSLGDFGIYLGDGYLIHGTLFQSLIGQKVTHGCIRLGDEDLEYLYRVLPVGGRVLIF